MTIINPNSIAGITSVTAEAGVMNFYKSDGTLAGLQLNGVNFNTTSGISTFNNVYVGGTITYEDVKNVDSVGIITARGVIDAQGYINLAQKIIHTGDADTSIEFDTNTIKFETAGSERLRIDSNGNVLIKRGSDVGNIIQMTGADTTTETLEAGITSGHVQFTATHASGGSNTCGFIIRTRHGAGGTTEKLRIAASGKVGINETSPQYQLHIHDDTTYNGIFVNGNAAPRIAFARDTTTTGEWSVGVDGTNGAQFAINNSNNNSNRKVIISSSQISLLSNTSVSGDLDITDKIFHHGDTDTAIRFPAANTVTVETAGNEAIRVDNAGRLLIGQTGSMNGGILCVGTGQGNNPVSGEGVKLAPSANTITFLDSNSNGSDTGNIQFWNTVYNNCSAKIEFYHPAGNVGGIKFHTKPAAGSNPVEALRIDNEGIIWANKSNPLSSSLMILDKDGSGEAALRFYNAGSNKAQIALDSSEELTFDVNGAERLRIDSTGMLGLGMTPNTWHTNNQEVFQVSGTNAGLNIFTRAGSAHLSSNFIYNSSDAGVFQAASGYAMHYAVSATNGTFDWLSSSAASSSAGSAATMVNRLRIDSSGRILIGTTSSISNYGVQNRLQVAGTDYATSGIGIRRDSNDSGGGAIIFGKSRGSQGGNTVVQSGDSLGEFVFCGGDGTDVTSYAATIKVAVDGTPGSNDMPGRIIFSTTPDGSGGVTERLRITSGGQLVQTTTHTSGSSAHQNTGWYGDDANHYNIEYTDFNEMYALKTLNSNTYDAIVYKRETMTQFCDMEFTFTGSAPGSTWRHFAIAINGDGSDSWSNFDKLVYRVHSSSSGNNHVRLDKGGGGTGFTSQGTHVPDIFDGSEHHFHLQIRKRQFTISVDGTLVCDVMTDANLNRSRGFPGFVIYEASTDTPWMKIRDFKVRNHTANAKANSMYAGGNKFIQLSRASGNSSETFTRAEMGMDDNEAALIYVTVSGTNLYDYGYHFFHWKMPRGTTSSVTDNIVGSYKASNVSTFSVTNSTNDLVVSKDSDLTCHVTIIGGGGRKSHLGW